MIENSDLCDENVCDSHGERSVRALLKLSGESLSGSRGYGHDIDFLSRIANDISAVVESGIQLCIVVGGGNIYRGEEAAKHGMDRSSGDYMGMLATVINALALQNVMENQGIHTRVMSAITMTSICEPYIRRKAKRHMEKGRVVIFAGGIGNPFFSTDSAAVLRAIELNCDMLLKGTQVDGVYDADPKKFSNAKRFESVTYDTVLQNKLRVMDMSGLALARENNLMIRVFSIQEPGNLVRVVSGEGVYTTIHN